MNQGCPNPKCKVHQQVLFQKKDGHYFREDDAKYIQRFKCKICGKKYSTATFKLEYRQKKRRWNQFIRRDYTAGKSMNRMVMHLKLHPKTIERKIQYLAEKARRSQKNLLQKLKKNQISEIQFDDLIASIHTKHFSNNCFNSFHCRKSWIYCIPFFIYQTYFLIINGQ